MYKNIKRLKDFDFKGKRVLMRLGLDMPLDKKRNITSTTRIDTSLPTVKYVLSKGAKQIIIVAHMGRPEKLAKKGEDYKTQLSFDVVADCMAKKLNKKITLAKDWIDKDIPSDPIVMLENVRFYWDLEQSDEEAKRQQLAKRLAKFGDVYINDAFSVCHRKEASVYDVAKLLPCGIGYLVDEEITQLSKLVEKPAKPYIALLGGAKVEDKIKVIEVLSKKVDKIIILGAMQYAFFKAMGQNVGGSLCEGADIAADILKSAYAKKIILPVDSVIAKCVKNEDKTMYTDKKSIKSGNIPDGYAGYDIGPETIALVKKECAAAKTIFWNGPAGMFEEQDFAKGTFEIAKSIAKPGITCIVGGGDSVTAIEKAGVEKKFTHVSTGGGASLEFIEGNGHLVAIDVQEEVNAKKK